MTIGDTIRAFLINELHWSGDGRALTDDGRALTDDYHLIENHVVDSLGLFTLVSFVEEQFGIAVEDEELLPENFGTIHSITALIERKRAARNPV